MSYQKHPLSSQIDALPAEAAKTILAAFRKAKCSQLDAAKLLDIAESTLIRWVKRLRLEKKMTQMRREATREGWHQPRGRPRKVA